MGECLLIYINLIDRLFNDKERENGRRAKGYNLSKIL